MNCMKCGSAKELSIKKHTRLGAPRFICRSCRRVDHHRLKNSKSPYLVALEREENRRIKRMVEWDIKAWKINTQIMRKYA